MSNVKRAIRYRDISAVSSGALLLLGGFAIGTMHPISAPARAVLVAVELVLVVVCWVADSRFNKAIKEEA